MAKQKIHRLAILEKTDKKTTLCGIITHDMIMSYIIANLQGDSQVYEVSIKELNIGTPTPISLNSRCTLTQVLQCMRNNKISFVPIVSDQKNDKGCCPPIGFFSLKDLITLIKKSKYHLVTLIK
jgi:predicted transcriptional regulator